MNEALAGRREARYGKTVYFAASFV
jgi:hypothetical protein